MVIITDSKAAKQNSAGCSGINRLAPEFPQAVFRIQPVDDYCSELAPSERDTIAKAVQGRKEQYSTGRYLAHNALLELGVNEPRVITGTHRQPIWPRGIVGSISHTTHSAAVAVASAEHYLGIGIDLELKRRVESDLVPKILTQPERSRYRSIDPTLIFCAKEAVFKLLFPLQEQYLDFLDIEILLRDRSAGFTATAVGAAPQQHLLASARGCFLCVEEHWLCCVAIGN